MARGLGTTAATIGGLFTSTEENQGCCRICLVVGLFISSSSIMDLKSSRA